MPRSQVPAAERRDAAALLTLDGILAAYGPDARLTRAQLSNALGVSPRSLTRWSSFLVNALPRYNADPSKPLPRSGALHMYSVAAVREWVAEGYAPFPGRPATG